MQSLVKGDASMKISVAVLLLLLAHLLYPYGEAVGDMVTPKDDDGVSPKIPLSVPFTFFNKEYSSAYVNNNGVISFSVPVPEYTPDGIPLKNGKAFIAPLWADVNNVLGGEVYGRQTHDPDLLRQITIDIATYYPSLHFVPVWAMVVTWDDVAYFGSASQKRNTFQAVLTTNGHRSFVILNYPDIQWTTGVASGGDRFTGLGGTPAQAGFNTGDDKNYYSIPGSRTPAIINITRTSNVNVPGRWVFEVGNFKAPGVPGSLMPENEELAVTKGNGDNSEVPGPHDHEGDETVPTIQVLEEEQHVTHTNEVHQDNSGTYGTEIVPVTHLLEEEDQQDTSSHDGTLISEESEILPEEEQLWIQEKHKEEHEEEHKEESEESEEDSDECKWELGHNSAGGFFSGHQWTADTLLYPYGPQYQDRSTPKADDGASPQISILENFYFYGKRYQSLFADFAWPSLQVNNNGVVSFGQPVSQFTPDPFPLTDGRAFVAPFWADVDNRITGEVYYRQTRDKQLLQRATADINACFPGERFTATWVFVATWDQVAFYGSLSSKVNTFQAVLTSNGERSFVMLNYQDIQWISGQASGGDANTGLEGTPAQAGFNNGDAEHYFNIPGSWTSSILNISSTSNVLDPGRWVFEVDVFVVPNGCVYKGALTECPAVETYANFLPVSAIFWSDPGCETKCQCLPDGHRVRCQAERCSSDEICHPALQYHICQHIHRASCQVLSGRHYTTFDGRLYHFRGNCTYVLSQMCVPSHNRSLEYYRVEAEILAAAPGALRTSRLRITVYDQEIAIPERATGHVMVQGIKTLLPVTLLAGKVQVRQSGFSVKVVTDWGMEVSYNGHQHVEVVVPVTYRNVTCGLCGTLNGNASDDFSTPNASLVTSVVEFATSWEAKDVERQCGEIAELLACPPSEQAHYSGLEYCGFLKTSPGPFTACLQVLPPAGFMESCVYDLCQSGGNRTVLCEVLRVYAEQCQAANVTVGKWRPKAFCGGWTQIDSPFVDLGTWSKIGTWTLPPRRVTGRRVLIPWI
ncbi:hypothetical protein lerEdw1_015226 [Lerista edwardsae]|nr:hypothetical protein lerEdw1_015227 [Lerista edwardsae]KAJ6610752.1 hypothetical protein lerEdw1_015226 [Lerista edwardsae]